MLTCSSEKHGWRTAKSKPEMFPQVPQLSSSPNSLLFTLFPTKATLLMSDFNVTVARNHYCTLSSLLASLAATAVSP